MELSAQHQYREPDTVATPALYPQPSRLFVEVTTRCNLRCPMCTKQSPGCGIAEGDMSDATFARIVPAFPQLEALILNGIGEPLLHASLDRFIKTAKRQLPTAAWVPSSTRRCDFIEGGSAFVSWDGQVHPCYFLWHRYRCHIGGLVKYVRPESFGSLEAQPILSIWNAPEFQAFRQGVLKYDFPFCYDCSVALCDYTQFEDFEQDCHISTVPCGACLWCTGLFRCLQ